MERELSDLVEIYYEQANVFSAIVGIFGTRALDQVSNYEKHRNIDTAQQRFPDLKRRGSGNNPPPGVSLESKGSKRANAIQSHYDHPGWYIVWRYLVDSTQSLEPNKTVIVWRVDVVYLEKDDWKYERSTAGEAGGGRTHISELGIPARSSQGRPYTSGATFGWSMASRSRGTAQETPESSREYSAPALPPRVPRLANKSVHGDHAQRAARGLAEPGAGGRARR